MTYTPPTPEQIRAFLRLHGLSGRRAAELAGLWRAVDQEIHRRREASDDGLRAPVHAGGEVRA